MQKVGGYLISGIGLVLLVLSIDSIYPNLGVVTKLPQNLLMASGVILAIFGLVLGARGGKKKEVPIYHGKKIVGYRRI